MSQRTDLPPIDPADLIHTLAIMCGIGPEVADLLRDRVLSPGPPLSMLLHARRQGAGLFVRDVAARSDMTHSQTSLYEAGIGVPALRSIGKLAAGYRIPFEIVLIATLRSEGILKIPAPGAKPIPRTRVRKCNAAKTKTPKG